MSNHEYLILYDADRIKEFVFATGRLKEIRGGSQLVKDASERETLQKKLGLTDDEIVYADGGAGILAFADEKRAETKAQELENFYRRTTHGATLTAVVQPMPKETERRFQIAKEQGGRRLRVAKENRFSLWQTVHSPFTQACQSCGAQPATHSYTVPRIPEALCEWCWEKRNCSDRMSKRQPIGQRLLLDEVKWGADFLSYLTESDVHLWRNAELPETTDKLAELSRPANYMGFLYADGNNMGRRFDDCDTPEKHRHLSQQVSFSLRAALYLALNYHFPGGPVDGRIPFEVIALGGDDVILLCAADRVLPVAITLSKLFTDINTRLSTVGKIDVNAAKQAGMEALAHLKEPLTDDDPITLSAAAIIAHPKQPILNLEKEAASLLGAAKRSYPGQAVIDFHVVSSPILQNIRDIRNDEYRLDDETALTRRPLLLEEAEKLLYHVRRIKSRSEGEALPRNKLNALYQALFGGKEAAAFETFFLFYRLSQPHRQKLTAFFADFGIHTQPSVDSLGMPWGSRTVNNETQIYTVLADLAELHEFVAATSEPELSAPSLPVTSEEASHDPTQN
ncbi:MAG: hypothetical protein KF893_26250 [Caldilineaceae bacterium]|nr:hypothetical protein [Caldilineaceae bacterium]